MKLLLRQKTSVLNVILNSLGKMQLINVVFWGKLRNVQHLAGLLEYSTVVGKQKTPIAALGSVNILI